MAYPEFDNRFTPRKPKPVPTKPSASEQHGAKGTVASPHKPAKD